MAATDFHGTGNVARPCLRTPRSVDGAALGCRDVGARPGRAGSRRFGADADHDTGVTYNLDLRARPGEPIWANVRQPDQTIGAWLAFAAARPDELVVRDVF